MLADELGDVQVVLGFEGMNGSQRVAEAGYWERGLESP